MLDSVCRVSLPARSRQATRPVPETSNQKSGTRRQKNRGHHHTHAEVDIEVLGKVAEARGDARAAAIVEPGAAPQRATACGKVIFPPIICLIRIRLVEAVGSFIDIPAHVKRPTDRGPGWVAPHW
jgi:hypothetical protein